MRASISLASAAIAALAVLAACGSDDDTGPNNTATVQFINATGSNLDASTSGSVATGNGNLAFGGHSTCMTVNAASPGLSFNTAGTSTAVGAFTPNFTAGGNYTVIAYPSVTGGTSYATISNTFTPTSGNAGLRIFDAISGTSSYDAYVTNVGGSLTTPSASAMTYGSTTSGINVGTSSAQQLRFTNAGTTTVALDAGNTTYTAGKNSIVVLAPAATGTTTLRSFATANCS
jgi:hypothetical protein